MSNEQEQGKSCKVDLSPDVDATERKEIREFALRRYESRMKLLTIVLGTMVVGLAGVLVPGVINYATLVFDRHKTYQTYITSFLEKGINQDIELRLRLAGYFANLADPDQKVRWEAYEAKLLSQRNSVRDTINQLEERLAKLCSGDGGHGFDIVSIDRTRRLLQWAYVEVGYAATNRTIVSSFEPLERRRRGLYAETRAVVERLSKYSALSKFNKDYTRFWELYRTDLIGIESSEVARRMVALGREIEPITAFEDIEGTNRPLSASYKRAIGDLFDQIDIELERTLAGPPAACSAFNETTATQSPPN